MFGHDWSPAKALIVDRQVTKTSGDGNVTIYEYVADVTPTEGAVFRTTVQEPTIATNFWAPRPGETVGVLHDRKSGKVKLDKDDPALSAKAHEQAGKDRFAAAASGTPDQNVAASRHDTMMALAAMIQERGTAGPGTDPVERLARLDQLKLKELISDEEYEKLRAGILGTL